MLSYFPPKPLLPRVLKSTRTTAAVLLSLLVGSGAVAQPDSQEYAVKAAFLFHFAQLIDWPAEMYSKNNDPLVFCTYEDDPARDEIRNTVENKKVGTRLYRFRSLRAAQEAQACQILFLSKGEVHRQAATLKALQGTSVLTVGETDSFFLDGGMIRFHLEDGRVRFDISVGAAESGRIKISSRLLLLASYVLRTSPDNVGGR